jgi:hypothetical protein
MELSEGANLSLLTEDYLRRRSLYVVLCTRSRDSGDAITHLTLA